MVRDAPLLWRIMSNSFLRQILSVLLSFTLTFSQGFYPALVLAQEATQAAIASDPIGVMATESAQIASPEPTPSPFPEPTPSPVSAQRDEPEPSSSSEASPSAQTVVSRAPFTDSKKVKPEAKDWVKGEILVKFKETSINLTKSEGRAEVWEFAKTHNLEVIRYLKDANITVLRLRNDSFVPGKIEQLQKEGVVAFAERNLKRKPGAINTNDPRRDELWGLHNIGQTVGFNEGIEDADIDAPEAWEIAEGKPEIVVAVIDTGIAYDHPDIVDAMWDGAGCKDENGNFLGGCKHGFDFSQDDKDPFPSFGEFGFSASHGTHIAGTIAATKNNSKGIIGVAPGIKVMALKVNFSLDSLVRAVDFARANGAKVINASYHSFGYSQAERESIERFIGAGGLFIASAGNNYSDNDIENDQYPAKYPLDGVISVAATDNRDNKASFSNWGAKSVDVGAPGVNILSAVADYVYNELVAETFNLLTPPSLPNGWTSVGNWQTVNTQDLSWGNVLYPDTVPYSANANSTFTSPKFDLTNSLTADVTFWARCDTEYSPEPTDFLEFQVSGDGVNFETLASLDEYSLDWDGDESNNATPPTTFVWRSVPDSYFTSDFQARFKWTTNGSDNNHEGCSVDDIYLSKITQGDEEMYESWSGTSMAVPHVSGLAALLWSANSNLTFSQVKSIILSTGDSIASLAGKTLTGKRINAARALQSVAGVETQILGLADDPSPVKSKTWNWYVLNSIAQFRYLVDQNPAGLPTGAYGDTKSASVTSGDGKYYLHVQALINGIESEVVTVYAVLDNTAPSLGQIPISAPISSTVQIPISSQSGAAPFGSITWEIVGDVSGVAHYIFEIVEENTGEIWEASATVFNSIWTFIADGIWNIFVTAEDNAGNKSDVLSQTIVIDTLGPVGVLTKPVDGASYNTLPDIAVDVQDSGTGVNRVNFLVSSGGSGVGTINGGGAGSASPSGTIVATDYEAPYKTDNWGEFELSGVPEGVYLVWAELIDNTDNRSVTNTAFIIYDKTVPLAPIIISPAAPVTVNTDVYKIEGEKEPVSFARVYQDGQLILSESLPEPKTQSLNGGGPKTFALTVQLKQNTANNFEVALVDLAGNESSKVAVPTITEDSDAPAITSYTLDNAVISPSTTPGVRDTASFDLAFSEEVAADFDIVDRQGVKIKDIYFSPAVTNPQAKTWDGKNNSGIWVADGVYTIKITITDVAGTIFIDTSKTITVDNDTLKLMNQLPLLAKPQNEGALISFTITASDEEGNVISYSLSGAPAGAVIGSATGEFSWIPTEAQGPGTYEFTVSATNGSQTKSAQMTLTIAEVNQAPVADNMAIIVNEDLPLVFNLTASDVDLPVNTLTFAIVSTPTNGTLGVLSGNQITYQPNTNFNGTDSFVFKVNDGAADATGVVSITVNPVNDAPTAVADTITTIKNTTIVVPQATLLVNDTDIEGTNVTFVNAGQAVNGTLIINGTNVEFIPAADFVGLGSFLYTVSDGTDTGTGMVTVVVNPTIAQDEVILEPVTNVDPATPVVVVGSATDAAVVNIPASVTNAVLDLFAGLTEAVVGSAIEVTVPADITLNVASTAGTIKIEMPQDITVSAPIGWNGEISAPKLESISAVSITAPGGLVNTTTAVIEVGAGDTALTFNKAVRIVIPRQAGKLAAWVRAGVITEIAGTCSADTQAAGDLVATECKIDSGADLVIWTKHFTKFVTFTQTAQVVPASTSGSSAGSSAAPSCNDTKPGSAPKLLSAQITGTGEVTLTWTPAFAPVTYYLVAYGNKSGEIKYGNPNVGGRDTVRYTVRGLGTGTYYFRVRAGNGCMPGDFSNELASSFGGQLTPTRSEPAEGFTEGVLGDTDTESQNTGEVKADETKTEMAEENMLKKLAGNPLVWVVLAFVLAGAGLYLLTRPTKNN